MQFSYRTKGTCSSRIVFEVENDRVYHVAYEGGCNGNLQGISRLVEGMPVDEAIEKLGGIRCGYKETSCPDQLARALSAAREKLARQKSAEK